jgi:hypothetical protein
MASKLPEKITDIKSGKELIKLLNKMDVNCTSVDNKIEIRHGGILYIDDEEESYCYDRMQPWFLEINAIQELYELYKQCLEDGTNYRFLYSTGINYSRVSGKQYLMLGGTFELIIANGGNDTMFFERGDLIFCTTVRGEVIIRIQTKYYYLSFYSMGDNDFDSYDETDQFYECTPVKSVFKFKKIMRANGDRFLKLDSRQYRRVNESYDGNKSFMCAKTRGIINAETGEKVKSWHLEIVETGDFKKMQEKVREIPELCNIDNCISFGSGYYYHLFYDKYWNQYYMYDYYGSGLVRRLNWVDSGKHTKSAVATE